MSLEDELPYNRLVPFLNWLEVTQWHPEARTEHVYEEQPDKKIVTVRTLDQFVLEARENKSIVHLLRSAFTRSQGWNALAGLLKKERQIEEAVFFARVSAKPFASLSDHFSLKATKPVPSLEDELQSQLSVCAAIEQAPGTNFSSTPVISKDVHISPITPFEKLERPALVSFWSIGCDNFSEVVKCEQSEEADIRNGDWLHVPEGILLPTISFNREWPGLNIIMTQEFP